MAEDRDARAGLATPGTTVLIAEDEPITRLDLREMLAEMGYRVVGEASDGWEAVQLAQRLRPSLVIMDIKMPRLDGLVAAQKIIDQGLGAVILLSAYSERELVEKAKRAGVAGYLVKPVREVDLFPAIETALAGQRRLAQLAQEIAEAREDLESRKLVERAKGALMSLYSLSEEAAYRRLRQLSMESRQSLAAVSRQIMERSGRTGRTGPPGATVG
ncbi:MAG: ANTAR domain-containing response regulator [Symbiobacteriia bacterium]